MSKSELVAIFKLEFYKKKRNWVLSRHPKNRKKCNSEKESSPTPEDKPQEVVAETEDKGKQAGSSSHLLNDAFLDSGLNVPSDEDCNPAQNTKTEPAKVLDQTWSDSSTRQVETDCQTHITPAVICDAKIDVNPHTDYKAVDNVLSDDTNYLFLKMCGKFRNMDVPGKIVIPTDVTPGNTDGNDVMTVKNGRDSSQGVKYDSQNVIKDVYKKKSGYYHTDLERMLKNTDRYAVDNFDVNTDVCYEAETDDCQLRRDENSNYKFVNNNVYNQVNYNDVVNRIDYNENELQRDVDGSNNGRFQNPDGYGTGTIVQEIGPDYQTHVNVYQNVNDNTAKPVDNRRYATYNIVDKTTNIERYDQDNAHYQHYYQNNGNDYHTTGTNCDNVGTVYKNAGTNYESLCNNFQTMGIGYVNDAGGVENNGTGYQNNGTAYQNNGTTYQNNGTTYQNNGTTYQNKGTDYHIDNTEYQMPGTSYGNVNADWDRRKEFRSDIYGVESENWENAQMYPSCTDVVDGGAAWVRHGCRLMTEADEWLRGTGRDWLFTAQEGSGDVDNCSRTSSEIFMLGAHAAPHSTEIDLRSEDSRPSSSAQSFSSRTAFRNLVERHTRALRVLLADRDQICTPQPPQVPVNRLKHSTWTNAQQSMTSFEEYPTRDVGPTMPPIYDRKVQTTGAVYGTDVPNLPQNTKYDTNTLDYDMHGTVHQDFGDNFGTQVPKCDRDLNEGTFLAPNSVAQNLINSFSRLQNKDAEFTGCKTSDRICALVRSKTTITDINVTNVKECQNQSSDTSNSTNHMDVAFGNQTPKTMSRSNQTYATTSKIPVYVTNSSQKRRNNEQTHGPSVPNLVGNTVPPFDPTVPPPNYTPSVHNYQTNNNDIDISRPKTPNINTAISREKTYICEPSSSGNFRVSPAFEVKKPGRGRGRLHSQSGRNNVLGKGRGR